tara:strand:+ start:413 stop:892 length:480 start_codon:yes stop_codon:yes gene_type:complete
MKPHADLEYVRKAYPSDGKSDAHKKAWREVLGFWYTWRVDKDNLRGYLKQVSDEVGDGLNANLTFYYLEPYKTILPHYDIRSASINFVLAEDIAPINFDEYGDFHYTSFAFDGKNHRHAVMNRSSERFVLQVGFFGVDYEEIKRRLERNGLLKRSSRKI